MVSHRWLPRSRSPEFTASHLSCASFARVHYQVVVRCTGSFRLDAGNRHLHRYYKFAVSLVKTAPRSLRHSCRSELHVTPQFPAAQTIRSPERSESRISLPKYFRLPDGFISIASRTISSKPSCSRCLSLLTNSQILSNLPKSACFDDSNGYALKCGSTFATKSLTFRTSNLRVLSDLSGRMNPHPHLSCIT